MGACCPYSFLCWLRKQPHSELRLKRAGHISTGGTSLYRDVTSLCRDILAQRVAWRGEGVPSWEVR